MDANLNLTEILRLHKLWLEDGDGGQRANLSCANLRGADLSGADLSDANLSCADLSCANLSCADLRGADLSGADLSDADLSCANLRCANLSGADLSCANLRDANLSDAKYILNPIDYLAANFEKTIDGYIVYKTFGACYAPNANWKIEPGSIIEEVVNYDRGTECACGVNVATLDWVKEHGEGGRRDTWKCLIRWEWMAGVCVPYGTDGKIRAAKVELLEIVK